MTKKKAEPLSPEDQVIFDMLEHCNLAIDGSKEKPQRVLQIEFYADGGSEPFLFGVTPESRAECIALLGEALVTLGMEITSRSVEGAH